MIFSYKNTAHVNSSDLQATAKLLEPYIKHLSEVANWNNYIFDESSINLPLDESLIKHLTKIKKDMVTKELKYIVVVGIGGANLGAKAVYDALMGFYDDVEVRRFPKMIFADTSDTEFLRKLGEFLGSITNPQEVLINVISKSGSTTETITNFEILLSKAPKLKTRLVVTTEFESPLWNVVSSENIKTLPIPHKVGDRYSIFSANGLFPLLCAGINVYSFLEGALNIREKCLKKDVLKNPAAISAIAIFLAYRKGKTIHDSFIFHPELETLGKWYRQLMAESIGKDGIGLTPTVSIGSTDLHSMYQLYIGGPRDKFFTFISSNGHKENLQLPKNLPFPLMEKELSGRTTNDVMKAIFESVKEEYGKNKLPYLEIELQEIAEPSLGKFMQMKMFEIMYLAKLLNVNAFDQPNVETYKENAKVMLSIKK